MSQTETETTKSKMWEWTKAIVLAVGLAMIIRIFLFEPYLVEGSSMDPTLHDGDRLFVNKTLKFIGEIDKGDIVIIDGKEENIRYVKRVIGVPGDKVSAQDGKVYVNGTVIEEPYLDSNEKEAESIGIDLTDDFEEIEVPNGNYFVMGDNRLNSMDSRNGLGLIEKDRILGKSEFIFFPFDHLSKTE
ncbi:MULTISPECIES: signal peptidase I [Metabacillus]|uniref:signal peptidase I n=1 Tax=Metabacillus TaxID=2675233 RepID=UPI001B971916|nr:MULTISPECIES: signal peptidase I [Metabacillus]MCM3160302.1 signal peptidase I [Metabacillus litoralis]MCM3408887.1 signal peptidase I [Metabacillus litoralis]UGB32481.1 signal peptidase I [Metabacillus sp. B2-18]UHA59466.1 signal peptidase I [Metabacillus litoralis]